MPNLLVIYLWSYLITLKSYYQLFADFLICVKHPNMLYYTHGSSRERRSHDPWIFFSMTNRHIILILWSVLGFDNPMKDMGLVCMRIEDDNAVLQSHHYLNGCLFWTFFLHLILSMPCAIPCDGIICGENICWRFHNFLFTFVYLKTKTKKEIHK